MNATFGIRYRSLQFNDAVVNPEHRVRVDHSFP